MADNLVKPDVIAKIFDVSVRRVQQLTQDGIIHTTKDPNGGANKYDLLPTVMEYIKYLSDKAYGRTQSDKSEELKAEKLKAEIALKKSQGELHQLKTEIAQGKYISVEDVKLDYEKFFLIFKKFAMSIPSRVGGAVAGYVEPVVERGIEKDLQTEVNSMLRSFVVAAASPGSDVL